MTDIEKKLERLEQDLAAFKREHAGHRHTTLGDVQVGTSRTMRTSDHGLLQDGNVDPKLVDGAIEDMRTNAENRAWSVIGEWIGHMRLVNDHSCAYEVRMLPAGATTRDNSVSWGAALYELNSDAVKCLILKRGTSRLDALAHLAAWCTEDMHK